MIGFSVAAITLIVSNITDLNSRYNCNVIRTILLLLGCSIFFGILFRIASLIFISKYQNILFGLEGSFSEEKIMKVDIAEISPELGIHKIQQKIKEDFNADYLDVIELYNQAKNEKSKEYYINYLVNEYKQLSIWAKKEYDYALLYVRNTFGEAFDLNDKQRAKIFSENNNNSSLKIWGYIRDLSISVSVLSFLIVVLTFAIYYR